MRKLFISAMCACVISLLGCGNEGRQETGQPGGSPGLSSSEGSSMPGVAGVRWNLPERWIPQAERPMRFATYTIPPAEGDAEGAECAVFYFGQEQGGDVRMNIDRWIGQFDQPEGTEESTEKVGGINVTLIRTTGTYLSPGGPAMQSQGRKDNFKLKGAIVEAPQGLVFFKAIGPARTLDEADGEFMQMIRSLK